MKIAKIAVTALIVVGTASCTTERVIYRETVTTTSSSTTTTTMPIPTTTQVNPYNQYVTEAQALPNGSFRPREQLIKFGDLVCEAIRSGSSASDIVSMIMNAVKSNNGADSDLYYFSGVSGIAIRLLCPDMLNRVKGEWGI